MAKPLKNIKDRLKVKANVAVVMTAAVLLLLLLTGLFLYLRNMLEDELERDAESELTMKAMIIRGVLNRTEQSLNDYVWQVGKCQDDTLAVYETLSQMTLASPHILGSGMPFMPDYIPSQGHLYEPYVMDRDGTMERHQLACEQHDYTQMDFYSNAIERDGIYWADPYYGGDGTKKLITTCSMPVRDSQGHLIGVLGADVLLDWISDTLDVRHKYPSSYNLLLTEEGEVISRPSASNKIPHDVQKVVSLLNDTSVERHLSESGRTEYIEFHDDSLNTDGTVFFAFMKGYPRWKLAVVCYNNEVYGKLDRLGMLMVALMLLTFGVLLFIINLFARNERHLQTAMMQQERINSELRVAQHIQMEMLPKQGTAFAPRNDLAVCGMQVPAKEVGGDVYDYFIRDEKLFFCIGDVSGKGVPSALLMAVIHALFHTASAHENNPARIMQDINETSAQGNESNMFVTLLLGVLDLPTGRLRYCNAGHDRPVLINQQCTTLPAKAHLPVGIIEDYSYQCQEVVIEPDTTLFLYTDGLTEAMNVHHEMFREERMMAVLNEGALTPDALVTKMQNAVRDFVGNAQQSDDLTMLAIRYTPQPEQSILNESLTLKNDVKEVRRLNDFVLSVTRQLQMDGSLANKVKLAVEEAVVNVIDYAYPPEVEGEVCITADADANRLRFIITDNGVAFDPTETVNADTSLTVEERPIGGLGLLLVRKLMDSINYERIDNRNVLTLTKNYKTV